MIIGIDLGSRFVKLATVKNNSQFAFYKYDTIDFYKNYGCKTGNCLNIDFNKLGFNEVDAVVSTGYGRNTVEIHGGQQIPELRAHVLGARWQTALEDFTLLDLGGQDSKVILVRRGKIVDFQTNDKCAASSGRYLENMANVLGITMEQLSEAAEDPVELNSTCAIFGESELIGKIIEGHRISSLAAGVNYSIFRRVKPMLLKLPSERIIFTGGVARNQAVKKIIERELGCSVIIPKEPQYNGALGCCAYGASLLE